MKRIFTAVDISDETRRKFSDYIATLRAGFPNVRVGWDKPEKLHLTLKFLGDINEKQLGDLTGAVSETAKQISDFKLRISKTGVFPTMQNARILWLGVEDEKGSLRKLNEILESQCNSKGFAGEKRSFKAHLTIGRLREPHNSRQLVENHLRNDFESAEFTIKEIVIYESKLAPTGSVYSVVEQRKLTG